MILEIITTVAIAGALLIGWAFMVFERPHEKDKDDETF